MTLIERFAKQNDDCPCLQCAYNEICQPLTRSYCTMFRKWNNYRKEAYREHLQWCSQMMKFKENGNDK